MSFGTMTFVPTSTPQLPLIIGQQLYFAVCDWSGWGLGGSSNIIWDIRSRAGLWQLPERLYLSVATRFVGGAAGFGLPKLRKAHPIL